MQLPMQPVGVGSAQRPVALQFAQPKHMAFRPQMVSTQDPFSHFARPPMPVAAGRLQANAAALAQAQARAQEAEEARARAQAKLLEEQAKQEARAELERQREEKLANLRSIEGGEGYFEGTLGCKIDGGAFPYVVVSKSPLGVGVFSSVWPAADKDNKLVALKIVRKQDHFLKFANKEVERLELCKQLSEKDLEGARFMISLREQFMHGEHLVMAFEKLEEDLRTVGRQPVNQVLAFSKQILLALRFLHEQVGLVHCDVKPDNLLMRYDRQAIKLSDFGTARYPAELQAIDELQPLFYRAPEVLVGYQRDKKIDIWSAGCTIYELTTGKILLKSCATHRDVMGKLMTLRGAVPEVMRTKGRIATLFFSPAGFHPENGHGEGGDPVPLEQYKKKPMLHELEPFADFGQGKALQVQDQARAQLSKLIGSVTVAGAALKKRKKELTPDERKLENLATLIEHCLEMDPTVRISASTALNLSAFEGVDIPEEIDLLEAPPLPEEAPPPLPPTEPPLTETTEASI